MWASFHVWYMELTVEMRVTDIIWCGRNLHFSLSRDTLQLEAVANECPTYRKFDSKIIAVQSKKGDLKIVRRLGARFSFHV
jgi:hypothetical protein